MNESKLKRKLLTTKEREQYGIELRKKTPIECHADWAAQENRPDPIKLIEDQNKDRVDYLIPVRRARMSKNAFTFYRGAARIMASDLSKTPNSSLQVQVCGDAHIANFGGYALPKRQFVLDINDFDETLPGPWEWDLKRLAVSFYIAGRHNGMTKKASKKTGRIVV